MPAIYRTPSTLPPELLEIARARGRAKAQAEFEKEQTKLSGDQDKLDLSYYRVNEPILSREQLQAERLGQRDEEGTYHPGTQAQGQGYVSTQKALEKQKAEDKLTSELRAIDEDQTIPPASKPQMKAEKMAAHGKRYPMPKGPTKPWRVTVEDGVTGQPLIGLLNPDNGEVTLATEAGKSAVAFQKSTIVTSTDPTTGATVYVRLPAHGEAIPEMGPDGKPVVQKPKPEETPKQKVDTAKADRAQIRDMVMDGMQSSGFLGIDRALNFDKNDKPIEKATPEQVMAAATYWVERAKENPESAAMFRSQIASFAGQMPNAVAEFDAQLREANISSAPVTQGQTPQGAQPQGAPTVDAALFEGL